MKPLLRKLALAGFCGYLLFFAAHFLPVQQELSDTVVRLHILAEDDTPASQSLKLKVRDEILSEYGSLLSEPSDKENALALLKELLPSIRNTARSVTDTLGSGEEITVSLSREYFPRKTYGEYTLPAGTYDALRVVIGKGSGKNWWCVAYPPLCFQDACTVPATSEELLKAQLTDRTYRAIALKDQPVIGFAIVKWFRSLFD